MLERPYRVSRSRTAAGALVVGAAFALATQFWISARPAGTRGAFNVKPPACPAGSRVSLPSDGWRLADGTFALARRVAPGPDGTLLFNDSAGRARCFRPVR